MSAIDGEHEQPEAGTYANINNPDTTRHGPNYSSGGIRGNHCCRPDHVVSWFFTPYPPFGSKFRATTERALLQQI